MKSINRPPGTSRLRKSSRAATSVLLAAVMVFGAGAGALPASAAPATTTETAAPAARSAQDQQIIDVFNGINAFRKSKGLPALRIGMNASAVAQEWSVGMAEAHSLVHSQSHANDMRIAGWWSAGENIAYTYERSGQTLVDMWINSPGHNANMSRAGDNVIGVGVASDSSNYIWGTTTYYRYAPVPSKTYATAEEYLAAIAVPAVPAEVPVILGTPAYGQVLRVKAATWPAGTSLSYQWWAGSQRIEGATGSTMTVEGPSTGEKISVEVTARKAGYRETSVFSAQTEVVPFAEYVKNTAAPKITGTPEWGKTLTLNPGVWEAGTKLSYKWESGESGLTHVVNKYDTYAKVEITATKPGRYDTTVEATLDIPAPKLTYSVKPSITGIAAVGQQLSANPGTWNFKPRLDYTWLRNGAVIPGSSGYMSYTLTPQDLGAVISFSADVSLQGYAETTVVSGPTAKVGPQLMSKNLTKPTITGTPVVGNGLETNGGTWEKDIAVVDYQWLRDGQPIEGERANFYFLTPADAGKKISVQGIGIHKNSGYGSTVATSASVTVKPASKPVPEPTPAPKKKFKDVPADMQFAKEIQWMSDKGISTGWADNTYRPQGLVSRDAMSAFMYRLAGSPAYVAPATSPFRDIVKGQQFYKEMSWLSATGVSTGWPDKSYQPLAPVNRDAMAAFMYRLAGSPKFTPPKQSPFTDVSVNHQFYKEIAWLRQMDISTGWIQSGGTTVYKPNEPVKRDAMAAFMSRFDQMGFKIVQAK